MVNGSCRTKYIKGTVEKTESPDDSYFPKSGGSTFLKTVGYHFSEICGNKITAYRLLRVSSSGLR